MRTLGLLLLLTSPSWARQRDTDLDGVPNRTDLCPHQPEDREGHLDGDGCPDPDNDLDGILDQDDSCPDQGEDPDGYQDADGCPDLEPPPRPPPAEIRPDPRLVQALQGLEEASGAFAGGCPAFTRDANAWLATWGPALPGLLDAHLRRVDQASGEERRALTQAVQQPMGVYQGHLVGVRANCAHDEAATRTREQLEEAVRLAWGS